MAELICNGTRVTIFRYDLEPDELGMFCGCCQQLKHRVLRFHLDSCNYIHFYFCEECLQKLLNFVRNVTIEEEIIQEVEDLKISVKDMYCPTHGTDDIKTIFGEPDSCGIREIQRVYCGHCEHEVYNANS